MCWVQPLVSGTMPPPRLAHSAEVYSNRMVIFGGYDGKIRMNDVFVLDFGISFFFLSFFTFFIYHHYYFWLLFVLLLYSFRYSLESLFTIIKRVNLMILMIKKGQ